MIELDVVTPSRRIVEGAQVESVHLPASRGELTVLPGHTELVTLLGTGLLSFVQNGVERKFAVSYGFAEVRNDKVLILAETCEEAHEIDKMRATQARKRAEQALVGVMQDNEFRKQQLKLQRAVVRQQVAQQ